MCKKNRIVVTIPFNKINVNEFHIDNNHIKKTEDIIIRLIWNNPNISIPQLMIKTRLSNIIILDKSDVYKNKYILGVKPLTKNTKQKIKYIHK